MTLPPSPIQFLYEDEHRNRYYLKREDLLPFSFGGNKLRIALGYLADFRREQANRMIAYGNPRSNLCRILSNLCAAEGIPMTVISPADDGGSRADSFNGRLCRLFGAEIVPCTKQSVAETVDAVFASCAARGEKPYYIYGNRLGQGREEVPPLAIAPVFDEILAQEQALGVHFGILGLACGTGMTLAGLAAGAITHRDGRQLRGYSIARGEAAFRTSVQRYLDAWKTAARAEGDFALDLRLYAREGESYGICSSEVRTEILRMMRCYGVPMDATYTGKGWCYLLDSMRGEEGQNVLFLHTGGTPLFFDWMETCP